MSIEAMRPADATMSCPSRIAIAQSGRQIERRLAAHAVEDRRDAQPAERGQHRLDIERRQQQRDVAQRLDIFAAVADQHDRPELRVDARAERQLAPAPDHRRDDHAVARDLERGQSLPQRVESVSGIGLRCDAEPNQSGLRLVGHIGRAAFDDDRRAAVLSQGAERRDGVVAGPA